MTKSNFDLTLIMKFLDRLKNNNNREWFQSNKTQYQKSLDEFLVLVEYIIQKLGVEIPEIAPLEPKKCIYRIYRDVRFSKDKTPYKTHFGAFFKPGGKKSRNAGYYLHLEPHNSIIAGGLYKPDSARLAKVRQEIDYNGSELKEIVTDSSFKKLFGEIRGEKLSRVPKGYPSDHPNLEILKLKSLLVVNNLDDKQVTSSSLPRLVIHNFKAMNRFIEFINVAIS